MTKHETPLFSNPRELSDDGLETYLESLDWWDTNKKYSTPEHKNLLINVLNNYFQKKVSRDFVIGYANRMRERAGELDSRLMGIACDLENLQFTKINNKEVSFTKEDVDRKFQTALDELTNKEDKL